MIDKNIICYYYYSVEYEHSIILTKEGLQKCIKYLFVAGFYSYEKFTTTFYIKEDETLHVLGILSTDALIIFILIDSLTF